MKRERCTEKWSPRKIVSVLLALSKLWCRMAITVLNYKHLQTWDLIRNKRWKDRSRRKSGSKPSLERTWSGNCLSWTCRVGALVWPHREKSCYGGKRTSLAEGAQFLDVAQSLILPFWSCHTLFEPPLLHLQAELTIASLSACVRLEGKGWAFSGWYFESNNFLWSHPHPLVLR